MARFILNIGLTGAFDNEERMVLNTLATHQLKVGEWDVQDGVLVVEVECPDQATLVGRVHGACCALGRDAIAALPIPDGLVIGPRASLYGEFDQNKFKEITA